jgi:hypothetical protein
MTEAAVLARLRYGAAGRRLGRGGRDDTGASLVFALLFITIVATGIAAMLGLADASLRATIAVRKQAAQSSDADGAAQVAINQLRLGTYAGTGNCFGATATLTLNNFYQPAGGGPADSAIVACAKDATDSQSASPGMALLTVGNATSHGQYVEHGILLQDNEGDDEHGGEGGGEGEGGGGGSSGTLKVQGSVGSRSDINVQDGTLAVTGNVSATTCTGTITATVTKTCTTAAGNALSDPNYPAPPAPDTSTQSPSMPSCASIMHFQPGIYTSASSLNSAMGCSKARVYDFRPGIYYFKYSGTWNIDDNILVAGAVSQITSTTVKVPGACPSQVSPSTPDQGGGVEFVFGNDAQLTISDNATAEICAKYSATTPPIAIYGLKTALGSGSKQIPAQTGCVASTSSPCSFFESDSNHDSSDVTFYIQGLVYAPLAWVDLDLRGSDEQYFNDGLVARAFSAAPPESGGTSHAILSNPNGSTSARTVVYLAVYVCPGKSTCTTSTGKLRLQARVGINDPTGTAVAGKRQITVYNWSVER